jgi:3-isopropylmalate/(R)-2-methylmalate dehydratase small subunit
MEKFTQFTSRAAVLAVDNIDTDQIIPARFLKTISKEGLGDQLFYDWRYQADGSPKPDFVLNRPESQGRKLLVAGDNFGCGSSREHAPWALAQYGFRAVISTSFADIFRNNALKNGLLPIVVDRDTHARLLALLQREPDGEFAVDLAAQKLSLPDGSSVQFPIDGFSKTCLLEGVDELGFLLKQEPAIAAFEARCESGFSTLAAGGGA